MREMNTKKTQRKARIGKGHEEEKTGIARVLERMPIMRTRAAGFCGLTANLFALVFVKHCRTNIKTSYGQ